MLECNHIQKFHIFPIQLQELTVGKELCNFEKVCILHGVPLKFIMNFGAYDLDLYKYHREWNGTGIKGTKILP